MRKDQKDGWSKARSASAWAVSALLVLQLAGASLPTALAQDVANASGSGEPKAEVMEGLAVTGQEDGPKESASSQTLGSQGEGAASETGAPTLVAQDTQDAVAYVDENGGAATRDSYALVAEPGGEDPLTLKNGGWYVVKEEVNISKRIEVQGDAHLILCDGAILTVSKGVHNPDGSTLSVYGQAQHTGELQATGVIDQRNAGIGGNEGEKAGAFKAYGARTVVQGGYSAAGIGGGYKNDGGTVLVRGEKTVVTANGGAYGAGIGGGNGGGRSDSPGTGYTGTVTVEGGTVTAQGGVSGAGIGGGDGYGADSGGGTVTIKRGTVNATGGENGAGIGGANGYINMRVGHTKGADVRIEGGTVTATGGKNSPGIGTGCLNASGGSLTVTGGNVNATGGGGGAGIGGGSVNRSNGEEDGDYPVTITGGNVEAKPESGLGAGIGGGLNGDGVTVKIGGTAHVEATGGDGGAGIGSGDGGVDAGSLEVTGGTVIAKAGPNAAGIGTGKTAYGRYLREPKVIITGGDVKAYGDNYGAGIGGGEFSSGGTITITGGKVFADGRDRDQPPSGPYTGGAGIGAGGDLFSGDSPNNGGTVVIGGTAEVEAIGGKWCAGIGGGLRGDGAEVTISDTAIVTATGGEGGAGIGGGWRDSDGLGGAGRTVNINGGTVTAQAGAPKDGSPAEAIGHGSGWDVSGDLTVYDTAKVLHGSEAEGAGAVISMAAQRIADCRDFWAQVSPCGHKDASGASAATFLPTASKLHHVKGCTQCLYVQSDASGKPVEYDHDFGATGECACGVHAYRVTFYKNASTAKGSMATSPYVGEGAAYRLPVCGFRRDGYAFGGWNTQTNGGGNAYADRAALTMGEADVELFAQWRPARFGAVAGVASSYTYNGKPQKPRPSVRGPEGQALREGTDYRLEWANNVNATSGKSKAKVRVVGTGEYVGVSATVEFAIAKSTPAAPAAPGRKAVSPTSVAVAGKAGCEYSIDGGRTWRQPAANGTATFAGLRPGTAYSVVGRVRATANTNASAASKALRVSTARTRASVSCRAHVQRLGWLPAVAGGAVCGTVGRGMRLEALRLSVSSNLAGGVSYRAHVSGRGWLGWARDGGVGGTEGQGRRVEALRIRLDGELAKHYSVYYRVHAQRIGWMAWARDGAPAGTEGEARRVEAVQVVLVKKGAKAPAASYGGARQAFSRPYRKGGPRVS